MLWMKSKSHSFTQISIFLKAPAKPGVYALYTSTRCIYVGETENLRETLYDHLKGASPWITVWDPSNFSFQLWADDTSRIERKNQLVMELQPAVKAWHADNGDAALQIDVEAAPLPRH
jgi:GIY-YIG catalytic domain-containing protein